MQTKLVCYSLGKVSSTIRTNLHRELYGFKDTSNYSRYKYERKGLIHELKCRKILDSLILTDQKNVFKLVKLLKKYNAKVWIFEIKGKIKGI